MKTYTEGRKISAVQTDTRIFYPHTDGKPMAASDRHRRILNSTIETLEAHYAQQPDVYVSGDILMYYVEGDPHQVISPDVLVSFGLEKKERLTYLVWVEGKLPDFVMEFSSKTTYDTDLGPKKDRYASLGIQDYFLYDALDLYLPSPLMGFTLVGGVYVPISKDEDGCLHSAALSLDFHVDDVGLGIYDPVVGAWLQTPIESAEARAEQEAARAEQEAARAETAETRAETAETRAETAETRAEQEAARAETAETRAEQEAARAEQEAARAEQEAARAEQEAARAETAETRAETAETEIAQLREQLQRLQTHN